MTKGDSDPDVKKTNGDSDLSVKLIVLMIYSWVGLTIFRSTALGEEITNLYWREIGALVIIALALAIVSMRFKRVKGWVKKISPSGRIKIIVGLVLPIFLVLVFFIVLIPQEYQAFVIRFIFFIVVSLFPPVLYYLFISSKKYTLLDEYARNLKKSKIFIMTGTHEGVPSSALEAMACGCLCIGYHGGGGKSFLNSYEKEQNCFLVETSDLLSLAKKLSHILCNWNHDPIIEKVIRNAQAYASTFTSEKEYNGLTAIWKNILQSY